MEEEVKKMSSADLTAHLQDIKMFAGQIGMDDINEQINRAHDKDGSLKISPQDYEKLQRFKEELKGVNERVSKQLRELDSYDMHSNPHQPPTADKPIYMDANGKPRQYCPGCFEFKDECKNTKKCQEFKL